MSSVNSQLQADGYKTIASSVEDASSLAILWNIGINYIQDISCRNPRTRSCLKGVAACKRLIKIKSPAVLISELAPAAPYQGMNEFMNDIGRPMLLFMRARSTCMYCVERPIVWVAWVID